MNLNNCVYIIDLKDKFSIMLENDDLRKGMVRFDEQYFYAKVKFIIS